MEGYYEDISREMVCLIHLEEMYLTSHLLLRPSHLVDHIGGQCFLITRFRTNPSKMNWDFSFILSIRARSGGFPILFIFEKGIDVPETLIAENLL